VIGPIGPRGPKRVIPGMAWATDTAISMPAPLDPEAPSLVPMGGFTFTAFGLMLDVTESDREAMFFPMFAPGED